MFTIAARHDEQLPPLPLPTHLRVGGPARGSVKLFRNVYVEADDGSAAGLLPPVVLGDILSDLPQVISACHVDELARLLIAIVIHLKLTSMS